MLLRYRFHSATALLDKQGLQRRRMAQVILPTTPQGNDASNSSKTLLRTLDDLLERYLKLLHEYQALQKDVAKSFSSVWRYCCLCSERLCLSAGARAFSL